MMKIEQIAIGTVDPQKLMDALDAAGITKTWTHDVVVAEGEVFGVKSTNKAELHFNYDLGFELEILKYQEGANWHLRRSPTDGSNFLSHMGLHVEKEEMLKIKADMAAAGIGIAQEVYTSSHENPVIKGKRKYHYVVFDSKDSLGFDLKLIERIYE